MTTVLAMLKTYSSAVLSAALFLLAVRPPDAWADSVPETHSLLLQPVSASASADSTVYAIVSNVLWRTAATERNWAATAPIPLKAENEEIRSLRAVQNKPLSLYLLTSTHLYASRDAGASWTDRRLVYETRRYNDLWTYPETDGRLLVATSDGAWISSDGGSSFTRFFTRVNEDENYINAVCVDRRGERVYIATRDGLFITSDNGKTFRKMFGLPPDITRLASSPVQDGAIAFVSGGRMFYTDTAFESFRLLSSIYDFSQCQEIAVTSNGRDIVWSYAGGVLWGKDWLPTPASRDLTLPVATAGALMQPPPGQAVPAQPSAPVVITQVVAAAPAPETQAAMSAEMRARYAQVMEQLNGEPSARDVVDAAILYADLHPSKVRAWLKDMYRSAWLPQLRVLGGTDFSGGYQYGRDGEALFIGDRPLGIYQQTQRSDEQAFRAEAEVTWDLSRLIFNPNEIGLSEQQNRQTELRTDVANTVTIYYFQRRSLVFRKLFNPPEDSIELSRLEFQIEELTTKIDTLSGNYFTQHVKEPALVKPMPN